MNELSNYLDGTSQNVLYTGTFGWSDTLAITDTSQFTGWAWNGQRIAFAFSREAAIAASTGFVGNAAAAGAGGRAATAALWVGRGYEGYDLVQGGYGVYTAYGAGDWSGVALQSGFTLLSVAGLRNSVAPSRAAVFGADSLGAARAPAKVPGYGWKDARWQKMVRRLQSGESLEVTNIRVAAELRRDAFPDFVRSRYRGPLREAPDLRGTYDWHDPRRMIHPGPHQTPHIQMKLQDGTWVRIEVANP